MKYIIIAFLIIALGLIITGFYLKSISHFRGDAIVGLGVLTISFLVMPLFIYHRYRKKKMSSFKFDKSIFKDIDKD